MSALMLRSRKPKSIMMLQSFPSVLIYTQSNCYMVTGIDGRLKEGNSMFTLNYNMNSINTFLLITRLHAHLNLFMAYTISDTKIS